MFFNERHIAKGFPWPTIQDSNVVAAGDCTNQFSTLYGRRIRLESVPNATEQTKIAAASICGVRKDSTILPWFWSDQYDLKLQIVGLSQGYDEVVVRGDRRAGQSFAAFYLKEGRLIAADCINRPQEFVLSKRIIAQNMVIQQERLAGLSRLGFLEQINRLACWLSRAN